jgi:hypothetical protein
MNAPMTSTAKPLKEIYASNHGIVLPPKVKRLLLGAEVIWFDADPLSQEADPLHFFFESHTSKMTDMLLLKHGMTDVSQYVNIKFLWGVQMELYYSMPNRQEVDKRHMEPAYFEFYGTIFPMNEKFKRLRDLHYVKTQMEFSQVPDDHKNKKFYETTKFKCVVVNV